MARCQYQKDRDLTEEWGLEMKILRTLTAMAAAAAALTIAAQARADVIDFYLNQPECTGSCTTVPPLIADSSAVEVIVTATGSLGDYTGATVEFKAPGTALSTPPLTSTLTGLGKRPIPRQWSATPAGTWEALPDREAKITSGR